MYSRLPIARTFRGNRKRLELSRVKLYRKLFERKVKITLSYREVRVSEGSSYRESTVFPVILAYCVRVI